MGGYFVSVWMSGPTIPGGQWGRSNGPDTWPNASRQYNAWIMYLDSVYDAYLNAYKVELLYSHDSNLWNARNVWRMAHHENAKPPHMRV